MLRYDEYTYNHETSKSELNIEECDGSLEIYVHRDDEAWQVCVHNTLRRRLLS